MMIRPCARLIVSAGLALAIPGLAGAQIAPGGHAPVDITADHLEVVQGQCMANWYGDAEALQQTSRLRADTLKVFNRKAGADAPAPTPASGSGGSCGPLDRMEADGHVYYVTPTQVVKADHGVYTAADTTIVMTGEVVAAQGRNVISGSRLTINTQTGVATMETGVTGRGQKGRVRGVLFPDSPPGGAPASASGAPSAPTPPPPRAHPQS